MLLGIESADGVPVPVAYREGLGPRTLGALPAADRRLLVDELGLVTRVHADHGLVGSRPLDEVVQVLPRLQLLKGHQAAMT